MTIQISRTVPIDTQIVPEQLLGAFYAGENQAHEFTIVCTRNGENVALAGTVTAKFLRPDASTVVMQGTISNGKVVVTLGETCYSVPGHFKLAIFVTQNDVTTCIYAAVGNVNQTGSETLIDGDAIIPDIAELIADIDAAVESIPPEYSALVSQVDAIENSVALNRTAINNAINPTVRTSNVSRAGSGWVNARSGTVVEVDGGWYSYSPKITVAGYKTLTYKRIRDDIGDDYKQNGSIALGMIFTSAGGVIRGREYAEQSNTTEYVDSTIAIPADTAYVQFTMYKSTTHGNFTIRLSSAVSEITNDYLSSASIAPIETNGRIASRNYAVGDYYVYNNKLYRVEVPMSVGDTIEYGYVSDAVVMDKLIIANNTANTLWNAAVRYNGVQNLTDAQQAQARDNIGAASDEDLTLYTGGAFVVIPAESDLDNYAYKGNYYCPEGNATGIDNTPYEYAHAFNLIVKPSVGDWNSNTTEFKQYFVPADSDYNIAVRTITRERINNEWVITASSWKSINLTFTETSPGVIEIS